MARSGIARHVTATTIATNVPAASRMTTGGSPSSGQQVRRDAGPRLEHQPPQDPVGDRRDRPRQQQDDRQERPRSGPRPLIRRAVASASGTASAEVTRANPRVTGRVPRNAVSAGSLTA